MDEQNMRIDLVMAGDRENFPIIGDIVRVKYTATLPESGKIVMSTKNILDRPWVEFVLGIDQVIKGFDRALPLMCIGERSRVTFTPEYGCRLRICFYFYYCFLTRFLCLFFPLSIWFEDGKLGLPPHIPPDASLTFDITLLGFRPRTIWVKPLIQDINTRERPYFRDMKISLKMSMESGIILNQGQVYSASMILNDDPLIKENYQNQNEY
jgi:hypothetical protein